MQNADHSADYYARTNVVHLDGTNIFRNEADKNNEEDIAALLKERWGCNIHCFGSLSAVDWYAERFGRVVGVLELKSRTHSHDTFPTVFLNVRKWLALSLASVGLGCPALFVVRFSDTVRWITLASIDASKIRIGGVSRPRTSPAPSDVEPLIEVPIDTMKVLR